MSSEMVLTDEELDEYLEVALSNGFSKGTANVSPADMAKLRPLLNHYAKKAHPFTACVRDNRKRFGPRTNALCAVLKDLIMHTTKWRNQKKKGLAQDDDFAAFTATIPDEFYAWLHEVEEEEILDMIDDAEIGLSETHVMGELFMEGGASDGEDGPIWKTILREGTWKTSPSGEGKANPKKPITVVRDGKSDPERMTISMGELLENFNAGAVEHVQVPTKHGGGVLENTGFTKDMRLVQGPDGKWELQAALDFTEPDVREKVKRRTIANTSAGILFNYVHKGSGTRYNAVLDHVALTNRPWLNGLRPFGAALAEGEEVEVIGFSEDLETESVETEGGDGNVADEVVATKEEAPAKTFDEEVAERFGLSADEVKERLAENEKLREEDRRNKIESQVKSWEEENFSPAVIAEARKIMLADRGEKILTLSEEGAQVSLTASEVAERLVSVTPKVELTGTKLSDEDVTGAPPPADTSGENDLANLSQEEKTLASQLYLEGRAPDEETAVKMARKKIAKDDEA